VLVWKILHVLSMVTMVTVFIGAEIFYAAAMLRRNVRALAFIQETVERYRLGWVAILGLLAGIVFGLLTAATGGFDFLEGWLIAAYILVAAFFVNAALIGEKVVRVGRAAMEAEAGTGSTSDVFAGTPVNRGLILVLVNVVLFGLIIIDMIAKPF